MTLNQKKKQPANSQPWRILELFIYERGKPFQSQGLETRSVTCAAHEIS